MPWYLYLALKQLFPTRRFISFFSIVSIMGVTIGVAVLIGILSVMNGFGEQIRSKIVDFGGHVTIRGQGYIDAPRPIAEELQAMPEVAAANIGTRGVVMAQHQTIPVFPLMYGLDVNAEERVIPVEDYLLYGSLDDLGDDSVLLSAGVARDMRAGPGDTIEVFTPLMLEKMKADQLLLPRELEVVGIYETGYSEVDKNTMIVTLRLGQELYGMGNSAHDIVLRLHDKKLAAPVAQKLNETLPPPLEARTWLEINQGFLFVLQMERTLMMLVTFFTVIVAGFSIASSLFISVVRKTREIGLLGAMGGRPWQSSMIFVCQGLIIGVVGAALGFALAMVVLHFRDAIVAFIGRFSGQDDFMLQFYPLANLPVSYRWEDFALVGFFTLVTAVLAGLIPALRAAALRPSEALRNE